MSRLRSAAILLAALAGVGGLLFAGVALLFAPSGHEDGNALTDNAASRAIRDVFDRDDAVIDAVQAAHGQFNEQIWGDGGDLTAACDQVEEAVRTARENDTYGTDQVQRLEEVADRVCAGDGSDLELHDALADVEDELRAAGS